MEELDGKRTIENVTIQECVLPEWVIHAAEINLDVGRRNLSFLEQAQYVVNQLQPQARIGKVISRVPAETLEEFQSGYLAWPDSGPNWSQLETMLQFWDEIVKSPSFRDTLQTEGVDSRSLPIYLHSNHATAYDVLVRYADLPNVGILSIDSHTDLQDPRTSIPKASHLARSLERSNLDALSVIGPDLLWLDEKLNDKVVGNGPWQYEDRLISMHANRLMVVNHDAFRGYRGSREERAQLLQRFAGEQIDFLCRAGVKHVWLQVDLDALTITPGRKPEIFTTTEYNPLNTMLIYGGIDLESFIQDMTLPTLLEMFRYTGFDMSRIDLLHNSERWLIAVQRMFTMDRLRELLSHLPHSSTALQQTTRRRKKKRKKAPRHYHKRSTRMEDFIITSPHLVIFSSIIQHLVNNSDLFGIVSQPLALNNIQNGFSGEELLVYLAALRDEAQRVGIEIGLPANSTFPLGLKVGIFEGIPSAPDFRGQTASLIKQILHVLDVQV